MSLICKRVGQMLLRQHSHIFRNPLPIRTVAHTGRRRGVAGGREWVVIEITYAKS